MCVIHKINHWDRIVFAVHAMFNYLFSWCKRWRFVDLSISERNARSFVLLPLILSPEASVLGQGCDLQLGFPLAWRETSALERPWRPWRETAPLPWPDHQPLQRPRDNPQRTLVHSNSNWESHLSSLKGKTCPWMRAFPRWPARIWALRSADDDRGSMGPWVVLRTV